MSEGVSTCPICSRGSLQPSDVSIHLPEVLNQWQAAIPEQLKPEVWDDYRSVGDRPVTLYTCDACGFGQFHPIVAGTSNFYQAIAAVDYYNNDKWEFDAAASEIEKAGARSILDVGCGSGLFLDYLKARLPEASLFGYELNEQLLLDLAKRGYGTLPVDPAAFATADGAPLQFDAICMMQVLEHVDNPVTFIETFLPLLRPGGTFVITTPNSEGPIRAFPRALTEVPPHHTTRWTERSFRALCEAHQLDVSAVRFEPLPDYLWDSYLPVVWDEPIWPALIFDPLARGRGLEDVGQRAGFAATAMRAAGIRWLQNVVGHTILVSATSADQR
ncbi:class I SAM-dependent methyltransferase [Rhizobium lusitanum]|uniref:2-polyprenyl-3-methyl-5-hydroxy-6-metoxy-1, 4-benzoquinol methylase n=1 Tax=Rhizobium lusitanum TaxID=293958 RepID=A0A7X0ME22_9HYPH|nr:class I SAM-dependent methyltransferase [Rhizobium lusitanum]MBB6485573.1 2-polyprenyl-3-methyl-5-hydroxy-6-metoxy-1,4-benzoquinol methylase [Rhizobium lusitanum]